MSPWSSYLRLGSASREKSFALIRLESLCEDNTLDDEMTSVPMILFAIYAPT
jgi:hypothetical protein